MTRTARQPHEWLTLGAGLVAACMWASPWAARHRHGQRPVRQSSVRMRGAGARGVRPRLGNLDRDCAKRAKRPPASAVVLAEMKAPSRCWASCWSDLERPDRGPHHERAWGWALMVAASLVGSLNLGVAFMGLLIRQPPPTRRVNQQWLPVGRLVRTSGSDGFHRVGLAGGRGNCGADCPCSARAPIASWQHLHGPSTSPSHEPTQEGHLPSWIRPKAPSAGEL